MPKASCIYDAAQALATVRIAGRVLERGANMVGTRAGLRLARAEPWLSAQLAANTARSAVDRITRAMASGHLPESTTRALDELLPGLRALDADLSFARNAPAPLDAVAVHAGRMSAISDAIGAGVRIARASDGAGQTAGAMTSNVMRAS